MSAVLSRRALLALAFVCAIGCGSPEPVPAEVPDDIPRLVIDVRAPEEFAKGHRPGALNLQLGWSQLESRARAYAPDLSAPISIRASNASDVGKAGEILRGLGYRDIAQADSVGESSVLSVWTISTLEARLASENPPVIIDVRTPFEWKSGTIEGAILVEQDAAPALVSTLDPAKEYAVICEVGYRSSQLASLLMQSGFGRVHNVIDGMSGWRKSH